MNSIHDTKILIVDDEIELLQMIKLLLQQDGFHTLYTASTGAEALSIINEVQPEAVLLDVMLPDTDGFTLMKKIRCITHAPVLFITARDESLDKLNGLGLGADDYIVKPFLPQEVMLRLRAVLRRTYHIDDHSHPLQLGKASIDMGTSTVSGLGQTRQLTAKEFAILEKLLENRGNIITIDALCMAVWQGENMGYENTLMVHIRRLREKIEADPSNPQYLLTVRGLGYRLVKEV